MASDGIDKRVRVHTAARDKLAADTAAKYAAGSSVRQLAQESGRSYGFIHKLLTEAGTPMRPHGGLRRSPLDAARPAP